MRARFKVNGRAPVTTAIKREGQPDVTFEYLLQQDGGDWKIINIVADGVSDLALKRAEYQRVFAGGGIEGLIAELEQRTARREGGCGRAASRIERRCSCRPCSKRSRRRGR